MALYRTISMNFWTDAKIVDDFTPEDRYFYLYLFTNPHTNLSGCYEISFRQMANETGYSKESVEKLTERFEKIHDVIRYSANTKELMILNWSKYNWSSSPKFKEALGKEIEKVKEPEFKQYLHDLANGTDTVSIRYPYGMDTSVTVTNTNSVSSSDSCKYKEIIEYLNSKTGGRFSHTVNKTRKDIHARYEEGFTYDDFLTVIDKKVEEWGNNPRMKKYLRPETLFGGKFERYLTETQSKQTGGYDWDSL